MAIPAQPSPTSIVTEAFKLFGKRTPTSSEITRAIDYGLELAKSNLMDMGDEWNFLRKISYQPLTPYVSSYQCPSDFKRLIGVRLLTGTRRDTAQAGAASTITLASSDNGTTASTEGKWIVLTGGTGANQARQIKDYDNSTKVATVDEAWTTTPDNTSTYLVVDKFSSLNHSTVYDRAALSSPHVPGTPSHVFHLADTTEGDLVLDAPMSEINVLEVSYYCDLLKLDVDVSTSTLYNTILRLLSKLFVQEVFVWLLQDDSRYVVESQKLEQMRQKTAAKYLYPHNVSEFHVRLDY